MAQTLPMPDFQRFGVKDPSGAYRTEVLSIVHRDIWEARDQQAPLQPVHHDFNKIFLNFNVQSPPCTTQLECQRVVRELQKKDMDAGEADISYNFLVGNDGRVYEGRGWKHVASFPNKDPPPEFPAQTLHIGMIGNYEDRKWPYPMMHSAHRLVTYGVQENHVHPTYYYA